MIIAALKHWWYELCGGEPLTHVNNCLSEFHEVTNERDAVVASLIPIANGQLPDGRPVDGPVVPYAKRVLRELSSGELRR